MRKQVNIGINTKSLYFNHSLDSHIAFYNSNAEDASSLLAIGCINELVQETSGALDQLAQFHQKHRDWCFGFLSYDLKNEVEDLSSKLTQTIPFPLLHFFVPRYVIEIFENHVVVHYLPEHNTSEDARKLIDELFVANFHAKKRKLLTNVAVRPRQSLHEYLYSVGEIKKHIQGGDIYEVNYCQEFFARDVRLNPEDIYWRLNDLTRAPFSAFYKFDNQFALSGSPERFLKKQGGKLLSQPIKGTIKRGNTVQEDEQLKERLRSDPKEQSENVMIVDLVRNDLARIAEKGSVTVDELCGVYTFETVHQLISTVSCQVSPNSFVNDILKATFPMGSMTGAPKIRAMQLIEQYEASRRGLYSGSIGYIAPNGDFDFNVVIRTLLYHQELELLSFHVGSAITSMSDPAKEYEECMLKARALIQAIGDLALADI